MEKQEEILGLSNVVSPTNIVDEARRIIVSDALATNVVASCWPSWEPLLRLAVGAKPTPQSILELGSQLSEIFKSTSQAGRGQDSLSGGGAAWEGLICFYLNLCLIGSNAVVFKKRSTVPLAVQEALTIMYRNVPANTESDLVCVTFPEESPLLSLPLLKKETVWDRLSQVAHNQFTDLRISVVQCKTNWNDNAQIPMLWDMLYDAATFRSGRIQLGIKNRHLKDALSFKYAFVTVPTNKLELYKPNSLAVRRVGELTGGNYWGRPTESGIAKSVLEIFTTAKMGPNGGQDIVQTLRSAIPDLRSTYSYFSL